MTSPLIVIVGADKGGVGKTTVSRAILDYAAKRGAAIRSFDTENGDAALRRFFPDTESLNVDTVPGQMKLVDAAGSDAVTVVDCRAGLLTPIMKAFDRIKLMEDVRNGVLRLVVVHVVGPNVASSREVDNVISGFAGAKVIHVQNKTSPDASFVATGGNSIEIPNMDQSSYEALDRLGTPFAKFATDPKQSRVQRGYVGAWLDDVFAAFDKAGLGAMLKE
jgi:hypothetical protein